MMKPARACAVRDTGVRTRTPLLGVNVKMHPFRRALLLAPLTLLLCAAVALVLAGARPASAQRTRYTNLVNDRFATVSSGPQSSLIVDVPAGATDAQVNSALWRTARAEWAAKARVLSAQADRLERAGLIKRGGILPLASVALVRKSGRLVAPPRPAVTRGVGGGTLTFRYTGFNATDTQLLQGFIATAYPRLVAVYGQPAVSGEVEVVNAGNLDNSTIPEVRRFAYGVYDASNNRILLPIFQQPIGTLQAMLLCMVHAFHGPAVFQYDAWEEGFARAAAAVVLRDPIFNQQYGMDDPSANTLYSLLRYYDLLNQPALGNNTFFPPSQTNIPINGQFTVAKMLWARIGMSGATWLKVYVENQNFFSQFNAAYYAQFDPNTSPSLAGNVPALKGIATPLLPNGVEGIAWNDWYSRQYVLDTSIGPGTKLFAFVVPGLKDSEGRQTNSITLVYYRTEKSGDETLLAGRGYGTYFDSSNATISLGPGSEQTTITEGEGPLTAVTTNAAGSDATRITMDFSAGDQTTRVYVPAGFDGDFQGVLLSQNGAKSVTVTHTNVPTFPPVQTLNKGGSVEGASFGIALGTDLIDLGVTTVQVTDGTNTRTYRINTGDGAYYAVLRDGSRGGGVVTMSKTFDSSTLPYLVSFPLRPLTTDVAAALGLPPNDFLLSYWNSPRTAYETFNPGQPSVSPLEMGRGYWLKIAPQDNSPQRTVTMTGVAPATETDLTISCPFGWNLVGSPFDQAVALTDVQVKSLQNDPIPWSDAVDQNLVAAQPFALDRATGQYGQVDAFSGGEWQGYWVRVLTPSGVTLLLPGPDSPTRSKSRALVPTRKVTRAAATRPEWSVRLRVHQEVSGQVTTAEATLGAVRSPSRAFDNRYDVEMPPAIVPAVSVAFPHTTWGRSVGGRYVTDFRDTNDALRATWDVALSAPADGPVTVTWDRLGTLPRRAQLTLVDTVTGDHIPLRSRSSYTFTGEAGKTRSLQIVAEATPTLPLEITNVIALPTRGVGAGLSVSYVVTRAAEVQFQVEALNGRVVRKIAGGRAQAAGQQRLYWDGRAQNGAALPPGPYTVTLSARDDDGKTTQVRRVITLLQ
jgi:hypothetical protein